MDVEDTELAKKIDDLIIKHNRYIDSIWRGEADPTRLPHTVADILALIAQQNAALLRELLKQKQHYNYAEYDYYLDRNEGEDAIPASILEAKLNAIEEEHGR